MATYKKIREDNLLPNGDIISASRGEHRNFRAI
jgi:hypothetical protein